MAHQRVKEGPSPSPKRVHAGLLPPPLPSRSVTLERDAKALQARLQEIDEVFHLNDEDNERRLRLRQLGEQQMVLQRLCEAALRTEEGLGGVTAHPNAGTDFESGRALEAGIVLTPRSLESISRYGDAGVMLMPRSASRTDAGSLPMSTPLFVSYEPPKGTSSTANTVEPSRTYRGGISTPPEFSAVETISTRMPPTRKTLPPLSSPALVEDAALGKERRLVEEFFGMSGVESAHPYGAAENERRELSNGVVPFVPPLSLQRPGGDPATSVPPAEGDMSEENFDLREEEQLLKCIMQRQPQRPGDPLREVCASSISRSSGTLNDAKPSKAKKKGSLYEQGRCLSALSGATAVPCRHDNQPHHPAVLFLGENVVDGAEKKRMKM
ncbi:hypothetical protein TraAM80_07672 [Trypanosoma rangeli]|uniref:Uncharacterized protein n=1 Tax=Trypanosoma rangeli TaxID=5698 RepID=A0A3R7K5L8_TRYRA|nr:uncharacterized protein TraAM80_07672 [Trypanosoma rangeli]RNF00317.1 hypothetical protein TraAM80_07672 [Trypanosoma rangeli]|eukprot:RNF00317.1 hypothetical protein TraAM80_07672 [Trypanosoma rangeli]